MTGTRDHYVTMIADQGHLFVNCLCGWLAVSPQIDSHTPYLMSIINRQHITEYRDLRDG